MNAKKNRPRLISAQTNGAEGIAGSSLLMLKFSNPVSLSAGLLETSGIKIGNLIPLGPSKTLSDIWTAPIKRIALNNAKKASVTVKPSIYSDIVPETISFPVYFYFPVGTKRFINNTNRELSLVVTTRDGGIPGEIRTVEVITIEAGAAITYTFGDEFNPFIDSIEATIKNRNGRFGMFKGVSYMNDKVDNEFNMHNTIVFTFTGEYIKDSYSDTPF